MYELGFVKTEDSGRTSAVSNNPKSRQASAYGSGPGTRFSNTGTDPRERVFYMNSVTSLDKTEGKSKLRLARVGESIEKGVEKSDFEIREQQKVQAKLTNEEKNFLQPISEGLEKAIDGARVAKKHFVSGIVAAQFGHSSPRAKIHKSIEHSKEQLEKTKHDHADAILQKTPKEILDFVVAQVEQAIDTSEANKKKPDDYENNRDTMLSMRKDETSERSCRLLSELESELLENVNALTSANPDPSWTPRADLVYTFEPPKNVVNGRR